jgi:hypothetical protein
MIDSNRAKFHTDPIFHSRAADVRGEESNVIYLTLLNAGIKLAQKGPAVALQPRGEKEPRRTDC